jgi:predicted O-linked N-acetylglucosamine transferase (SPINDLY family)
MNFREAFDRALALHKAGDLAGAEAAYRQVLGLEDQDTGALSGLAEVVYRAGRNSEAVGLISEAARKFPTDPSVQMTLAIILGHEGKFDQAVAVYRRLIALRPDLAEAYTRMATPLLATGRAHEAIEACRRSLELRPDHMPTTVVLCSALSGVGDLDEVVALCRDGLSRHPEFRTLCVNLGWALREQGKVDEAIACYREALGKGMHKQIYDDLLFTLHFHPGYGREEIYREHREWAETFARPRAGEVRPHGNDASPDRRIRLGYVAHDLGNNPVGRFMLPLLENHDRGGFEVFVYCDRRRADAVGDRLAAAAGVWRATGGVSDERLAERIREDRVDVLVDLIMHSNGSRLMAFARKPAPVQVTYLAYCSTTGLDSIDYRLTDWFLDPPGCPEFYSEKSVRLPKCYWCYAPPGEAPDVGPLPALSKGHITFGCLNEFSKVTHAALSTWCDVLRRVGGSKLLLHAKPGSQRAVVAEQVTRNGIDPARVEFVGRIPLAEYFSQYNRIDIALDPFPYAGGTTTLDALWMGVPVVTLAGDTAVGRGGVSILSMIGLADQLASLTPDHYVATAVSLASDVPRLSDLRQDLRQRVWRSPLPDSRGFTRGVEDAFRGMWRGWCEGRGGGVR